MRPVVTHVAWSICVSVCREPLHTRTDELIEMLFGVWTCVWVQGTIKWRSRTPREGTLLGILWLARTYPRSIFSALFARGHELCSLWLPVYCRNLLSGCIACTECKDVTNCCRCSVVCVSVCVSVGHQWAVLKRLNRSRRHLEGGLVRARMPRMKGQFLWCGRSSKFIDARAALIALYSRWWWCCSETTLQSATSWKRGVCGTVDSPATNSASLTSVRFTYWLRYRET